jgi:UDP-N-acetylglucosamine transferase subunit ALG13
MIFVTVGSQKFQFDRLLKKIDELIAENTIQEKVFAQSGASNYKPRNFSYQKYLDKSEFDNAIDKCSLVITHGGTGVVIGAVKKGKKVIAIPRLKKYGEHVDDHQIQLLEQFSGLGIIEYCRCTEDLKLAFFKSLNNTYRNYNSQTEAIVNSIDSYIERAFH